MEVFGVQLKNETSYKWQENHTTFMKTFVHILLTLCFITASWTALFKPHKRIGVDTARSFLVKAP